MAADPISISVAPCVKSSKPLEPEKVFHHKEDFVQQRGLHCMHGGAAKSK